MLTKGKRWLGALLALCMAAGLIPTATAEAEPVSGTVARGVYLDAAGNSQSYESHFNKPLPTDGCELTTGFYYLTEDLDLTTDFTVADNALVKLDLAGHILRGTGTRAVITVGDNATLFVYDSDANADNPTPTTHYYTEDEDGVWIFDDTNPSGTPWTGGVITGGGRAEDLSSSIRSRGGLFARYTNYDPATSRIAIALFGGSVCGNRQASSFPSAGITAEAAKVLVAGGTICGNQEGRCVEAPYLALTGGLLQGDAIAHSTGSVEIDEASTSVNGVTHTYPGTMVMRGGTIRDASVRIGGLIPVRPCRFIMSGGEITGTVDGQDNSTHCLVGLEASTFEMYGGSIHDASADCVIYMASSAEPADLDPGEDGGCTFLLDGGTIAHNTTRYALIDADAKDTVLIRGGRITGNASARGTDAGVIDLIHTWSGDDLVGTGTCVIEGGEISGNHYPGVLTRASCDLSLSGAVKLTGNAPSAGGDIRLLDGSVVTVAGPLCNVKKIAVSMEAPDVFTHGWSAQMGDADPADYFTSAMAGYKVAAQSVDGVWEAALVVGTEPGPTPGPADGTLAKGAYIDAEGDTQRYEVTFDTPLPVEGCELASGNYYLADDLDLTTDFTVADNAVVKLDLAGHILRGTGKVAVISVGDNACLEVYDSDANADNPTPTTHYYTEDEDGVWVFDDANTAGTPWTGGVITGGGRDKSLSLPTRSRGGLFASNTNYDPATSPVAISLFGGSVCGNRLIVPQLGEGVLLGTGIVAENAKVFVAGGSVCGNQKGLCVQAPFFTFTGGLLQGNSRYDNYPICSVDIDEAHVTAGGVTTKYPGNFVMRGGTVRDGAINLSGVRPAQHSRFTMYGGEITGTVDSQDNTTDYLVGIHDSVFEMYGGSIHDARADHVLHISSDFAAGSSSTFLLDGGVITHNAPRGDIISATAGQTVILRSGKITNNIASRTFETGTIELHGGTLQIEGGEISGNLNPGALSYAHMSLSGAVKLNGNSPSVWGDIRLMDGGMLTIAGPLRNAETIAVSMKTPGVFTSGWSAQMGNADPADYFTSAMEGYEVKAQSVDGAVEAALVAVSAPIATHTATFVVGDEVVDRVVFEEGAATLAEPALPQRANYVGQWERYDLAAATGDITIHGFYTPVDPDAVSDVDAGVTATYDQREVTIDLFARAGSRTVKVVSQQTKPVDVVLVLDQSGSMKDSLSARDRQSKRDALVRCANAFVDSLYENAVASGADHRVAVVGFAYSSYNGGNYKNTGLLATPSGRGVNYQRLKESDYRSALLPINDGGHINANVVSGINAIQADGATAADLGLKMARDIFSATPAQGERERIVIFITDGTPTAWGEEAGLIRPTAATAISVANTIKNAQGAKLYSVGVHAGADPAAAFTEAKDGITTNRNGAFVSYDFNRFLHAVSSNYPGAAAMDKLGDGNQDGGFYMGVRDTEGLDGIFTNILYSTVYQLKTFDKATLYYTLSPAFTLTTEQELAMRQALAAQGLTDADIQVLRDADGTTRLRFRNVKVREVYDEDGTLHYEAAVRFQVSANQSDAVPDPSLASWAISEAVFSPAHVHNFELAYQTGSCREGLTSVYRCACGETRSETAQSAAHDFVAVLADGGSAGTEVERVVCTRCGHSEEQHINFKVSYSSARKTTVLDLNLLQNDVDVVEPTEDIELRFFVGGDGGRLYTVTRIDADGKRTTYRTQAENGYLVFRADHFSIYVLSELDETASQPVEEVSYEQAVELLDRKTVSAPTAPLEGSGSGGGTGIGGVQIANDTLSATVDLADGSDGAVAVLAAYAQGRMVDMRQIALAPGRQSVNFSIPEGADRVKLFVLSGDSAPLCGAYQVEP